MEVPTHSRIVSLQCKNKRGVHQNGSTSGAMH